MFLLFLIFIDEYFITPDSITKTLNLYYYFLSVLLKCINIYFIIYILRFKDCWRIGLIFVFELRYSQILSSLTHT